MLEDQGISNEERERLIEGLIDMTRDILFLPYRPNSVIAERYAYTSDISKLIWDFRVEGSNICKRQILEIVEDVMQQEINFECAKNTFSVMLRIFHGILLSGIWKDYIWKHIE